MLTLNIVGSFRFSVLKLNYQQLSQRLTRNQMTISSWNHWQPIFVNNLYCLCHSADQRCKKRQIWLCAILSKAVLIFLYHALTLCELCCQGQVYMHCYHFYIRQNTCVSLSCKTSLFFNVIYLQRKSSTLVFAFPLLEQVCSISNVYGQKCLSCQNYYQHQKHHFESRGCLTRQILCYFFRGQLCIISKLILSLSLFGSSTFSWS